MYKIKQRPEDFIVNEIFSPKLKKQGDYVYFRLKKTNYNTIDAIKKIANAIKLPFKRFGFAGAKDKNAVTSQVVSVKTNDEAKITMLRELKLKDIEIEILGKSDQPVSLGDHEGNEFIVTIRNLKEIPKKINTKFINYFGPQRFGLKNALIGKAIIKKSFQKAVKLIDRPECNEHIKFHPNDFTGAIRKLPNKLISLFVHAYQSDIWNRVADKVGIEEFSIPGFGAEYRDEKVKQLINKELKKDSITSRDFIIRQIPNIHTEGRTRKKWVKAEDFKILEEEKDELHIGKKKLKIKFRLPKGSYATVFIKSIFASS